MARRQHLTLVLIVGLVMFFSLTWFMSSDGAPGADPLAASKMQYAASEGFNKQGSTPMGALDLGGLDGILTGGSIAPKLGNETAKYVRHTLSFPLQPLPLLLGSLAILARDRRKLTGAASIDASLAVRRGSSSTP